MNNVTDSFKDVAQGFPFGCKQAGRLSRVDRDTTSAKTLRGLSLNW